MEGAPELNIEKELSPLNHYDSIGWDKLEHDPIAGPVFQEMAYNFIQTNEHAKADLEREFMGKLDGKGFLILKDGGNTTMVPSQILAGPDLTKVGEMTKAAMKERGMAA